VALEVAFAAVVAVASLIVIPAGDLLLPLFLPVLLLSFRSEAEESPSPLSNQSEMQSSSNRSDPQPIVR
jgi:hypothetical protein